MAPVARRDHSAMRWTALAMRALGSATCWVPPVAPGSCLGQARRGSGGARHCPGAVSRWLRWQAGSRRAMWTTALLAPPTSLRARRAAPTAPETCPATLGTALAACRLSLGEVAGDSSGVLNVDKPTGRRLRRHPRLAWPHSARLRQRPTVPSTHRVTAPLAPRISPGVPGGSSGDIRNMPGQKPHGSDSAQRCPRRTG